MTDKKKNETFKIKNKIEKSQPNADFDMELNTCSSCDCTGLIPRNATDSEIEAYEELYPYLPDSNP